MMSTQQPGAGLPTARSAQPDRDEHPDRGDLGSEADGDRDIAQRRGKQRR